MIIIDTEWRNKNVNGMIKTNSHSSIRPSVEGSKNLNLSLLPKNKSQEKGYSFGRVKKEKRKKDNISNIHT